MFRSTGHVISLIVLLAVLAGCATSAGPSALPLLPERTPSADETSPFIEAMNGGIISRVAGEALSDLDRRRAIAAEYNALETSPVGQSVTWSNDRSGLSGEVSAAQAYQVGAQNCRRYTHVLRYEGGETQASGTACRAEDGTWTPLS